jgi:hypothetical protein
VIGRDSGRQPRGTALDAAVDADEAELPHDLA